MTFDIKDIAKLAHLRLSKEEESLFSDSMNSIVHFVETITSLDLTICDPVVSSSEMPTRLREDISIQTDMLDILHQNIPCSQGADIIVPQVIQK